MLVNFVILLLSIYSLNACQSPTCLKVGIPKVTTLTNFYGIFKIYKNPGFNPEEYQTLKEECNDCEAEMFMNATELIRSKGIPCEEHEVITADGYILGLQRLVRNTSNKIPILIVHGFISSSDGFVINLRNQSLAYVLYDHGYDVWLGNVRGNKYSTSHTTLNPDNAEFWKWSFDEMGRYDVPAMIDHILDTTGHSKVNYIGHSQGTVVFTSAVIQNGDKVANKVKNFFALAPAGIVSDPNQKFRFYSLFTKFLKDDGGFMYFAPGKQILIGKYCMENPLFCEGVLNSSGVTPNGQFNKTRLGIYGSHEPSSTSIQNFKHWSQMFWQPNYGVFFYDHKDAEVNYLYYNQDTPPAYNFSKFNVSTYFYCGRDDSIVLLKNCRKFSKLIPSLKRLSVVGNFTHADFVYGINSKRLFRSIIRKIRD